MISYSDILKRIRKDKKLTQYDVAAATHTSQAYIQKLEAGNIDNPGADFLRALVMAYSINPFVFFYPNAKPFYSSYNPKNDPAVKKMEILEVKIAELHALVQGSTQKKSGTKNGTSTLIKKKDWLKSQ